MNLKKLILGVAVLSVLSCELLDILPSMPFNDPKNLDNPSDPKNAGLGTFTLIYSDNGSSGGTAPPTSTHKRGEEVIVAFNTGELVCTGCRFGGWNTAEDGMGINYTPGAGVIVLTEDITLYARWLEWGEDYTSPNLGKLLYIPPGRFQRGAGAGDVSVLSHAYLMGAKEVTREQFTAVMGTDPSAQDVSSGLNDPVQNLSWYQAVAFCNKLSLMEGLTPAYTLTGVDFSLLTWAEIPGTNDPVWNGIIQDPVADGYRLPTEMEWMWAAMGAPPEGQSGGTDRTSREKVFSGSDGLHGIEEAAWVEETSGGKSHPTGLLLPNELGLYDMSGNVWEWCWDWYADHNHEPEYGVSGIQTDYQGPGSGTHKVIRGGGWDGDGSSASVAHRTYWGPEKVYSSFGFRVVLGTVDPHPKASFQVTYDSNGATGGSVPPAVTCFEGGAVTLPGNTGNMVKNGLAFAGWYSADNPGKIYAAGEKMTVLATTTLMARWVDPTIILRVHFKRNSWADWPAPYIYFWACDGVSKESKAWPGEPLTPEGKDWWYFDCLGATKVSLVFNDGKLGGAQTVDLLRAGEGWYSPQSTALNGKIDGQWSDSNPDRVYYKITYDGNGSTGGTVPLPSLYEAGSNVTVASNAGGLVRTDFNFLGWNTLSDGTGFLYGAGTGNLTLQKDMTLYAQWEAAVPPIPSYTLTYDPNGATGGVVPGSGTYPSGTTVTVSGNTGYLSRTYYSFTGWNTLPDGTGTTYTAGVSTFTITAGTTLYAQWTLSSYTLAYNANGATGGVIPSSTVHNGGTVVTVAANSGSLVQTGYAFGGWNTLANGGGTTYSAFTGTFVISGNTTLYALWVPADDYNSPQIGLLKYVPAGKFQRDGNVSNIAVITKAYRMSQQEVTRQQFLQMFSGTDPVVAGGQTAYSSGTSDPVMYVNWYHAIAYCNKLSLAEGLSPVYSVTGVDFSALNFASIPTVNNATWNAVTANWNANGYRLPTEMEWMWAAMGAPANGQGGGINTTAYLKAFAGSTGTNPVYSYAWIWGNSGGKTNPVRTRQPNELGLYDMSGNILEWCWDWYGLYPGGTQIDYKGMATGSYRMSRGGSWDHDETWATVSFRTYYVSELRNVGMGFRVIRP